MNDPAVRVPTGLKRLKRPVPSGNVLLAIIAIDIRGGRGAAGGWTIRNRAVLPVAANLAMAGGFCWIAGLRSDAVRGRAGDNSSHSVQ